MTLIRVLKMYFDFNKKSLNVYILTSLELYWKYLVQTHLSLLLNARAGCWVDC